MPLRPASRRRTKAVPIFDAQAFLHSPPPSQSRVAYGRGETIFTQGDACLDVFYVQTGGVTLSVTSKTGKEVVAGILGAGDFFGEACLAGELIRTGSARAMTPSTIVSVGKAAMGRLLRTQPAMAERFIAHLLGRNRRIEEDLIDQLFNSSEKRLARTLLVLARYGTEDAPSRELPALSQEMLAEMIGSTRSRVNFFLNKFRKLGFVSYQGRGAVRINRSLLSVLLHD